MPKTHTATQPVPKFIHTLGRGGKAWWLELGLCDLRQDMVFL